MASAQTQGEAIVAAARAMESDGYPYCFDGGNKSGPTVGITDRESDGSYSNCASIGRVGFDCTGLTLYAVYQGTGNGGLSHDGYQARSGGGQTIGSVAALQPGDVVYFDYNAANGLGYIDHAGIYVGGGQVLSAVSEKYGIRTESIAWYEAGSLHFVGGVRYWSGNAGGGGGIGEGSYVQVSGHGEVFEIVGGAPLYVSSWGAVGGPQPVTAISQQQFDALRPYPADGTLVNTTNDGRVYEFAGGAPLYVSSWSAIGGPKSTIPIDGWDVANPGNPAANVREYPADGTFVDTTNDGRVYEIVGGAPLYISSWSAVGGEKAVTGIDGWDVANVGNPYAHLRPYPADGTLVSTTNDGRVYEFAGGAPLYVSSWSAVGGEKAVTGIDGWDVANPGNPAAHLREYPADGTLINTTDDGRVYVVAGGAPLYLSSWSAIGGSRPSVGVDGWDVANVGNPYAHLRPYPADGTFLNTSTGRVYRVAGGAPIAVSSWSVFGGVQPYTTIDQWDVDNDSSPYAHLRPTPLDGTEVEGLPSHSYWLFGGGLRSSSPAASGAVAVDDAGLAAFPVQSSTSALPSSAATSSRAPAGSGVAAASKKHKGCHKIKNRHKRARCAPAARHRKHRKAHGRARARGGTAIDRVIVSGSRLLRERASAPSATPLRWQLPDYRLCGPKGAEPLAWVADLHHVARRTACRVARKIIEYPWPESGLHRFDQYCANWLRNVHQFDGWNVKVPDHGLPRISRGRAWFSFQGEDFPVGC
jgi:cell wall-associated NlpC family hydrolase